MAALGTDEGSAGNPSEGSIHVYLVQPRFELYTMSRPGLHGREHARPVFAGLREIFCPNRGSVGQHAGEEAGGARLGANSYRPVAHGSSTDWRDSMSDCHFDLNRNHAWPFHAA